MWRFCSASFSTSLSPRSRLSPVCLVHPVVEELAHIIVVLVVGPHHVLHIHPPHHHPHLVHEVVRSATVGRVWLDVAVLAVVLVHRHRHGKHHVLQHLHVVALVDHGVDKPIGRSEGWEGKLWSIFLVALGNGSLHGDCVELHVLLAPAALHRLHLHPLLHHFLIFHHFGEDHTHKGEEHKELHLLCVSTGQLRKTTPMYSALI